MLSGNNVVLSKMNYSDISYLEAVVKLTVSNVC
jgi:hypothetical protein